MKKIYLMPQTEIVNVRLMGSVLEDPNLEGHNYSIVIEWKVAKESSFEEESLINPTQPNLWDDNEEE